MPLENNCSRLIGCFSTDRQLGSVIFLRKVQCPAEGLSFFPFLPCSVLYVLWVISLHYWQHTYMSSKGDNIGTGWILQKKKKLKKIK